MPIAYVNSWIDSYEPNVTYYLSNDLRKELYKLGERAGNHDPAGTYAHKIYNRLMIDLSYNSSRLEGNTYSLLDTECLLLHSETAEGKLDEEKAMILNHKEAIRFLVENSGKIEITPTVIYTLHYLLSDGLVNSVEAGKVRRHGVRISGSIYTPFEDPKQLQRMLEEITFKASLIKDPYEQSFFLLVHISYLQAFIDVNKRTARLAANIPLIKNNLVPLAFNDVQVEDYMSSMIAVYELQDIRPMVDLYVYSYMRTCAAYDSTIQSIGFDEVRIRYRQERRELVRLVLLGEVAKAYLRGFVENKAEVMIPSLDRKSFVEDVLEDLSQIDSSRIFGLGVTLDQLNRWLELNKE